MEKWKMTNAWNAEWSCKVVTLSFYCEPHRFLELPYIACRTSNTKCGRIIKRHTFFFYQKKGEGLRGLSGPPVNGNSCSRSPSHTQTFPFVPNTYPKLGQLFVVLVAHNTALILTPVLQKRWMALLLKRAHEEWFQGQFRGFRLKLLASLTFNKPILGWVFIAIT